jgi:transcriptional regulator with XRE-family HTH domain
MVMNIPHPIPNKLREDRESAGLRQQDIAMRLGLQSTDRISRWEQGQTFPHVINLFKLAAIYGVEPRDLYGELWKMIQRTSV